MNGLLWSQVGVEGNLAVPYVIKLVLRWRWHAITGEDVLVKKSNAVLGRSA